ncbi:MAG: methyltransferase [Cyclobacteriaceae bacterium]
METTTQTRITPAKIIETGMAFWPSKTLLTAVKMELFTLLAKRGLSGSEIMKNLGLHERSIYDFLDTLVALGFLERAGFKESATYSNAQDSDLFLDKNKPSYVGGILEMANNRLYPFWGNLEEGLKTGLPQNESKGGGKPLFEELYADEARLKEFLNAMNGIQMGNFMVLANQFDFSTYNTHCDIGGAGGHLAAQVAMSNPHMACTVFDLPKVCEVAGENIAAMGLNGKVKIHPGDFFEDDFPRADVITMGMILHDWGTKDKKMLIKKAYDALSDNGKFVVIENVIDDERKKNAFGLMMSLNMLIETDEGYDFSASDFNEWASEVGFKDIIVMPLTGPTSAIIASK